MTDGLKVVHREAIIAKIAANDRVERAVLFGSRATGTNTVSSDVDIALFGSGLTLTDQARLAAALDEIPMAQSVDLLLYDSVTNPTLREHIRRQGVEWFARSITRGSDRATPWFDTRDSALSENWSTMPFTDAFLINPAVSIERGSATPFVDMAAVDPGLRAVHSTEVKEFRGSGSRFRNGDTLMARITPCLENGKIARYYADSDPDMGHGSTEFIVVRGRPEVTDTQYAFYVTRSDLVRGYAIGQMTGTSGRQRVPAESLAHLDVAVPPLSEQRIIAHILGTLDDKIELNRRMNATLEAMARALFRSWFVDFDPVRAKMEGRDTGLPKDIADLFPDRLVDSALGEIPDGWHLKPLDSLASFQNGLALQKFRPSQNEARLPVVKITQLRAGETNGREWASATIKPECIIENGDIVFSWSGSLLVQMWCGGRAALNQHLFKVTSERYPKWFYLHSMLSHFPEFQRIAKDKATTMGHIRRHHLTEALCVVPPDRVISRVSDTLGGLLERQVANELTSRTLVALRDLLLPKLVSGELPVNALETVCEGEDRPASVGAHED